MQGIRKRQLLQVEDGIQWYLYSRAFRAKYQKARYKVPATFMGTTLIKERCDSAFVSFDNYDED